MSRASSFNRAIKLSAIIDMYVKKSAKNSDKIVLKEKANGRSRSVREILQQHVLRECTNHNKKVVGRRGGRGQIHDQID